MGKTPAAGDLQTAELALNTADKRLYSKDTNGNIFEIGAGGDVPSGGTGDRPGSPTIGDLFYDTDLDLLLYWNGSSWEEVGGGSEVIVSATPPATADLEEGTLWWNSDAGDLSLYVLYNDANPDGGLKWIEASPMPGAADIEGYPDTGDGNGATLDDRYVSKTVADHKVGDLSIGPDTGTQNIEMSENGVLTGKRINVLKGINDPVTTNGLRIFDSGSGICLVSADGAPGTSNSTAYQTNLAGNQYYGVTYAGTTTIGRDSNGDPNITLDHTGSALFTGVGTWNIPDSTAYNAGPTVDHPVHQLILSNQHTDNVSCTTGIRFYGQNSRDVGQGFIGYTRRGSGSRQGNLVFGSSPDGSNWYQEHLRIGYDGSAMFVGAIDSDSVIRSKNGNNYVAMGVSLNSIISAGGNGLLVTDSNLGGQGCALKTNGDYKFTGNGVSRGLTFELEPDDPANYTTTTDSEGNETQVYNGPTLDVKERLEAAQETFQELLVAVQSATDFGELKAAMLVALEDYA